MVEVLWTGGHVSVGGEVLLRLLAVLHGPGRVRGDVLAQTVALHPRVAVPVVSVHVVPLALRD